MEPLEKFNFEETWRQALQDAATPPPVAIWEAIEKELDKKPERKPVFWLWLNSGRFQAAAGVALVFLFSWLFFGKNQEKPKNELSKFNTSKPVPTASKTNIKSSEINQKIASTSFDTVKEGVLKETNLKNQVTVSNTKYAQNFKSRANQNTENISQKNDFKPFEKELLASTSIITLLEISKIDAPIKRFMLDVNELASKAKFQLPPNRLNRKLLIDYEFTEVAQQKNKSDRGFFMGLQTGVGSFNPNFSGGNINALASLEVAQNQQPLLPQNGGTGNVTTAPNDIGTLGVAFSNAPMNATTASGSYKTGLAFGMKLNNHVSIESGLQYLRGNSFIESNTYAIDRLTGSRNTFLTDYLVNNAANTKQANVASYGKALTTVASDGRFGNRYEYLSVPLQVGFTFFAKQKLNMSLLGGAAADIFVGNTIAGNASLNVQDLRISSMTGVYKPLNISGLGGFRINYQIQKKWSTYIGGQYQQGLSSVLRNSPDLNLKLKQTGLQYGVNFRF